MTNPESFFITLKDGTKAKHYDLLRYRNGATAIMRAEKVETDKFGQRIYGKHITGDTHSAYAHDCVMASESDVRAWKAYVSDRTWLL